MRFTYTSLEPALLSQVAATAPGRTDQPVRLSGHRPVSPAAGRLLRHAIRFVHDHVLTDPTALAAPLIASTVPQWMAATVLNAFPNTAVTDPTIEDRHDSHPATLRRAIAFIDDHAHHDITVADIAAATHVTIRALQYAFRRHRDTTPMGYLRQVRLHHAHQELMAADPTTGATVTQIAAHWGFFHPGRFAHHYRHTYGHPPHETLLRHTR
ncbi:helix-turn-helix transcriptional regulator [Actinocrispum wychmicini]|uniref:helix-turn-helix transcriptional regulator n=1 Tax=Actinocrispum wychmicini TaxID=1213861 RepID=UPI001FB7C33E|nr:helix-turn-helix transcriptional regulator [Actinocrispum wychmicini]